MTNDQSSIDFLKYLPYYLWKRCSCSGSSDKTWPLWHSFHLPQSTQAPKPHQRNASLGDYYRYYYYYYYYTIIIKYPVIQTVSLKWVIMTKMLNIFNQCYSKVIKFIIFNIMVDRICSMELTATVAYEGENNLLWMYWLRIPNEIIKKVTPMME